ncbi:MAG: hypothetical protein GWN31_11030 [Candidatus Thorarchaeota archaeon]|nr:hypothetical protein [Candidatus Thorarchaeota archaeon]
MGVRGRSYGGDLTSWTVTQIDRFKAAAIFTFSMKFFSNIPIYSDTRHSKIEYFTIQKGLNGVSHYLT